MSAVRTFRVDGFLDPACPPELWTRLLARGASDVVFLTWEWQRAWWETLGDGELLLLAAERDGEVVALAPLYAVEGLAMLVGSGGSDALDFVGDVSDPEVLDALLAGAAERVAGFAGFRFYFIPDGSETGKRLAGSAARLGLACAEEGRQRAPFADLGAASAHALTRKQTPLARERSLLREGALDVRHLSDGDAILPELETFFAQHVARRAGSGEPSHFLHPPYRAFVERLTRLAAHTGWLRFTRIDWQGRPIAYHFGTCYRGTFFWYNPSFDIALESRSPGQVLLRQVLLLAIGESARVFDFGLGEEPYKARFASGESTLRTWGLYPRPGA